MNTQTNRRTFIQSIIAASAAPVILPSSVFGQNAPSKKINIGMIGMGRQAYCSNLQPFLKSPDCTVTAVCDVDAWRLGQGLQAGLLRGVSHLEPVKNGERAPVIRCPLRRKGEGLR